MKEDFNSYDKNHNNLLKNICNILKECSNKEGSYATFLQTELVSIGLNENYPFNTTHISNKDIFLLDPTTIKVNKSGVYHLIYKIPVYIEDNKDQIEQSMGLYINNVLQKNIHRTFGITDCCCKNYMHIIGDDIVYIPENSIIQLRNNCFLSKYKTITSYNKEGFYTSFDIIKIG